MLIFTKNWDISLKVLSFFYFFLHFADPRFLINDILLHTMFLLKKRVPPLCTCSPSKFPTGPHNTCIRLKFILFLFDLYFTDFIFTLIKHSRRPFIKIEKNKMIFKFDFFKSLSRLEKDVFSEWLFGLDRGEIRKLAYN